MRAKFLKRGWVVILSACLVLSQTGVCFADTFSTMDPEDYLFFMVFRACGIPLDEYNIAPWTEAYKGYLESTHNNTLLSQINGYSGLSWGDTAHGVDTLFKSVKKWLSLSDSYGTAADCYSLPSSVMPLGPDPSMVIFEARVSSRKADVSCNDSNYVYSFSIVSGYSSGGYAINNFYAPKGQEIVGYYENEYKYNDLGEITFYTRSGSGYSLAPFKSNFCRYTPASEIDFSSPTLRSTDSVTGFGVRSLPHFPFKIFRSLSDIEDYFKTGNARNIFSSGVYCLSLPHYSDEIKYFNAGIQKVNDCQVGESLLLSESGSGYWDTLRNSRTIQGFMSTMEKCGMDIAYNVPYKLGHYTQKYSADGTYKWEKVSETTHTGAAGKPALIKTSEFPGFTYAPELVPEEKTVLLDGSLEVPVYYTCDPVSYKVEHYKESFSGDEKSWELADTETLQGLPGVDAEYSAKEYPGYSFDASLTEPSNCQVLPDGSLVIRLYYTCDPVSYKIEHYKESVSGDKKSWELADTETLQGIPGTEAKYSAKEYAGYSFNASLTEPSECQVLPDGSLVIRLYYTRDPVPYKTEHYKERFSGDEKSWELADTEILQGIPGVDAKYSAKEYAGYSFDASLTEPSGCQVLPDGSLVIRLYYTCDPVPFTVEYYKESFVPSGDEKSWLLADTEALQGIPGVEAEYPVKEYPGYSFDSSLTEPSNCQVLPDGSLVIRLYYTQAPFSVLTEPVNKAAGSALPVAAVVGSVLSGGFFLLKLYKRVTAKA